MPGSCAARHASVCDTVGSVERRRRVAGLVSFATRYRQLALRGGTPHGSCCSRVWGLFLNCVLVELGWVLEELQRSSTVAVMARCGAANVNGSPFAIQLTGSTGQEAHGAPRAAVQCSSRRLGSRGVSHENLHGCSGVALVALGRVSPAAQTCADLPSSQCCTPLVRASTIQRMLNTCKWRLHLAYPALAAPVDPWAQERAGCGW